MAGGLSHEGTLYASTFLWRKLHDQYRTETDGKSRHGKCRIDPTLGIHTAKPRAAIGPDRENDINASDCAGKSRLGRGGAFITSDVRILWRALVSTKDWNASSTRRMGQHVTSTKDLMDEKRPWRVCVQRLNENLSDVPSRAMRHVVSTPTVAASFCEPTVDDPPWPTTRLAFALAARYGPWQNVPTGLGMGAPGDPAGTQKDRCGQKELSNGPSPRLHQIWLPENEAGQTFPRRNGKSL